MTLDWSGNFADVSKPRLRQGGKMATKLANDVFAAVQADLTSKGLSNPDLESLVYDFLAEVLEGSTASSVVNSASDWADFELFELQAQGW